MKKLIALGAMTLATPMLLPAASLAAVPPKFTSTSIVPNVSLAQFKLGEPAAAARRGFPAADCTSSGCDYQPSGATWSVNLLFVRTSTHGRLFLGQISVLSSKPGTPVDALSTSRGITIGSTVAAVKRAYPHATGNPKLGDLFIKGPGEHSTTITFVDGKVTGFALRSINVG